VAALMKTLIDGPIAGDPRMGRIEIRQGSPTIDDPWGGPIGNLLSATHEDAHFRA
jgi:hypothetical protein